MAIVYILKNSTVGSICVGDKPQILYLISKLLRKITCIKLHFVKSMNYLLCFQKELWYNQISAILKLIFPRSSLIMLCWKLSGFKVWVGFQKQQKCLREFHRETAGRIRKRLYATPRKVKTESPKHPGMVVSTYETSRKVFENQWAGIWFSTRQRKLNYHLQCEVISILSLTHWEN